MVLDTNTDFNSVADRFFLYDSVLIFMLYLLSQLFWIYISTSNTLIYYIPIHFYTLYIDIVS